MKPNFDVYQQIQSIIAKREAESLLRVTPYYDEVSSTELTINQQAYKNFSGNDYLGLASDFSVGQLTNIELKSFLTGKDEDPIGLKSGSMASPLVSGEQRIHRLLKQRLIEVTGANSEYDCLLFSSGFAANQSLITALASVFPNACFLQDKLIHASLIKAGIDVSATNNSIVHKRFKHNDLTHLESILNSDSVTDSNPKVILTEGVFSMDGDMAPLSALIELKNKHNTLLIVDDAHGFGCFSNDAYTKTVESKSSIGTSLTEQGVSINDIDAYLITFGKALGSQGAALILKKPLKQVIENFAKEYIYSTSLSPLQVGATLQNINTLANEPNRQSNLAANIALFKECFQKVISNQNGAPAWLKLMPSNTAIQPILVGDESRAIDVAEKLKKAGYLVTAMRTPTVPKGQSRLRVTMCSNKNERDIIGLIESLLHICLKDSPSSNGVD